jgi:hypothetical protein
MNFLQVPVQNTSEYCLNQIFLTACHETQLLYKVEMSLKL